MLPGDALLGAAAGPGASDVALLTSSPAGYGQPWLFAALLLLIAYFTNPNEASFRSFLTDLSFQLYLRKLRAAPSHHDGSGRPAADAHILTFSNHVSIWLKTPRYKIQSCGFFTIVAMSPESLPGQPAARSVSPFSASTTFFFGAFGRWWSLADTAENEALALKDRVASSVITLETTDDQKPTAEASDYSDQEEVPASEDGKPHKKPVKATFRAGSRRATPNYRYHTKTRITTPTTDTVQSFSPPHSPPLGSPDAKGPTLPPDASSSAALATSTADEAAESLALSNIGLLEAQLEQLETSSAIKQSKLSEEVEALRVQKKEEDHARSQLKSKSRTLEESKRLAEVDHHESERKLAAARHSRHTLEDKIDRLKSEVHRLERKEAEAAERMHRSRSDRERLEGELGSRIRERQAAVAATERATRKLVEQVEALERDIEERKVDIVTRRQFGYLYRNVPTRSVSAGAAPPSSAQWATYRDAQYGLPPPVALPPQPVPSQVSPDLPHSPPALGFLEHRRAHLRDGFADGSPSRSTDALVRAGSLDDLHDSYTSTFAPFGPTLTATASIDTAGSTNTPRNVSLPFFVGGHLTSLNGDEPVTPSESQLDGPLSPMTPHQASLIPTQLFNMLDEDDDDVPASPVEIKPACLGQAHPEEAEKAFRFGAIGSGVHQAPRAEPAGAPSQEQLIADDDLLSHQLRPPRHPLSLNPDAAAFSLPLEGSPAKNSKSLLFGWNRKDRGSQ